MTRTAPAARIARARDFSDCLQSAARNLSFNSAFRNKEARADERFVAAPVVARGIAVLANRRQQRVAGELRTVLSSCLKLAKAMLQRAVILPDYGGFGSRDIHNPFGQQRRGRNEHTTTRHLELRLRNRVIFIYLKRKAHVRTTD